MLLNTPMSQSPRTKPNFPSLNAHKSSKSIQNPTPSHKSSINSLAITSKKITLFPKKLPNSESSLHQLNDPDYLQRLFVYQQGDLIKINTSKTQFFTLGTNSNITNEIMVYIGQEGGKINFCKLSDFNIVESHNIKFSDDLQRLLTGKLIQQFKKVGWIILKGDQWGFLLDQESLEAPRKGNLPVYWQNLLETEFFFKKLKNDNLPSVFRDPYLAVKHNPVTSDKITSYLKDDIKWMYNLEKNHTLEIREILASGGKNFFDTGYCLANHQTKLIKAWNIVEEVAVPGGILNSQTGSGKTASIIELISLDFLNEKSMATHTKKLPKTYSNQSLIITSEYTIFQWKQEFEKLAPHIRLLVLAEDSDLDKLFFAKINQENFRIKDCDVILANRKILEGKFPTDFPLIFSVNFQRVVVDDIHEILLRHNKRQALFEEMRFAQIQCLNEQENELRAANKIHGFLCTIQSITKKFLWGISSVWIPSKMTHAFFNLIRLELPNSSPEIAGKINQNFLELHCRGELTEIGYGALHRSVIKIESYQIGNYYLNPASRDISDKAMVRKITKKQLAEFKKPNEKINCISEVLEIINFKQQSDVRKIQTEISSTENDDNPVLNERIKALQGPNNFYSQAAQLMRSPQFDCPICLENLPTEKISLLSCLHHLCDDCYKQFLESPGNSKCPVCTKLINGQDLIMHPRYRKTRENKFAFLLKEIQQTPSEDKIIIFAQFNSVLKTIAQSLNEFNIPNCILKGECSEMFETLKNFKESPNAKVLLMSIKQGKSGVDIPQANHVFFAQPLFEANRRNAAKMYNQCVGRVLRKGQQKDVYVKLFLADGFEDHVEEIFMESWS